MSHLTFSQRCAFTTNPTAKKLLQLMARKRSNLSVSLDVIHAQELLDLAEKLGPEICVLKTHIDIISDFSYPLTQELRKIAAKHDFLIFEDRKFADIGHTVKLQYSEGVYRIAEWADITNAHPLVGPGIIEGLKEAGMARGNGLLLLAQMSPKGNLINADYTQASVEMAEANADFVIGFVAQQRLAEHPGFIYFTPGVNLAKGGDHLGQQYTDPEATIKRGSDVIIVGRGIYAADNPLSAAQRYREIAWDSYEERVRSN